MRIGAGALISRALIGLLLLLAAAVALTPLLWLVAASTKGPDDLFHYTFFSPRVSAQNFTDLFNQVPFKRYMINSVFVACATVLVQLVRTTGDGNMMLYSAGVYLDKVVLNGERAQFAERIVVPDSRRIETLLVIPL